MSEDRPIAYYYELANSISADRLTYLDWTEHVTFYEPCVPEGSIRNLKPLYAKEPSNVY